MNELTYLSKTPHYDYLKAPPNKYKLFNNFNRKIRGMKNIMMKANTSHEVYRQAEPLDYKPFDEIRFRDIVAYAI